jgi:hypothetical protein
MAYQLAPERITQRGRDECWYCPKIRQISSSENKQNESVLLNAVRGYEMPLLLNETTCPVHTPSVHPPAIKA